MLDEKSIRKRVFLRLLGSPGTVLPFILGMTAMAATWALNWEPGLGVFAGLAGALVAAGTALTRLLLAGDHLAEKVVADHQLAEQKARQETLDRLDRRLTVADEDPRPETALRDLRALVGAFESCAGRNLGVHTGNVIEILSRIGLLFDQCVESLEQTDELWNIARNLRIPAARRPILEQREKLILDVQASIKQLSDTLVALQRLGAGDSTSDHLAQLRDELDRSLAVARAVEERIHDLVKETSLDLHPPSLPDKPRT